MFYENSELSEREMNRVKEVRLFDFTNEHVTGKQAVRFAGVRAAAEAFAYLLLASCPENREKSLAMTKLEECVMWTKAAICKECEEG